MIFSMMMMRTMTLMMTSDMVGKLTLYAHKKKHFDFPEICSLGSVRLKAVLARERSTLLALAWSRSAAPVSELLGDTTSSCHQAPSASSSTSAIDSKGANGSIER